MVVGAALGGIAAVGGIVIVAAIIYKLRAAKLATESLVTNAQTTTSDTPPPNFSAANNSVAPASSYEPALHSVQIPDAPGAFGYDGAGGIGGPAVYDAPPPPAPARPPGHVAPLINPPVPEIPQLLGYTMAGQEPALPNIVGAADYDIPDIVAPAVYNSDLWL